jgi:hypothetical protein
VKTLLLACLFPALAVSCASDTTKEKPAPTRKSLGERLSENDGYAKDSEGNWKPRSDKRSPYENVGQDPNFVKNGVKKKEYKTGDYSKKSWWGSKEYDRKAYGGKTDGSRFAKSSTLGEKGAREANTTAKIQEDYQTSSYATSDAREGSRQPIAKPSNDAIENRRKVFAEPEIIDWKEQRSLSMDQSKGILGR